MVYVPEKGERVRVLEVSPNDTSPTVKVGDVIEVEWAETGQGGYPYVVSTESRAAGLMWGTFCKVEPVADEPAYTIDELRARVGDPYEALDDAFTVAASHGMRDASQFASHAVPVSVAPARTLLEPLDRVFNPDKVETIVDFRGEPPPFMSTDSATRKLMPVATGVLAYFPDALMCVAWVSRVGNDKHNPGEPLHWAKEKSADEPDAEVRHMLDGFRELPPDPGLEPLAHLGHLASKAWRANADLQRACDEARAAYERGEEWRK